MIIINKGNENIKFEEELAKDVLEIITVFSASFMEVEARKTKNYLMICKV